MEINKEYIDKTIFKLRSNFLNNITLDLNLRKRLLIHLKNKILSSKDELFLAFQKDYNKSEFDVTSTELGLVINELNYAIKNFKRLTKRKRVRTNLINFPAKSYILKDPYGLVLIISPWNYPFLLSLTPLIGAISSGNVVILKTSSLTKNVSRYIKNLFDEDIFKDFIEVLNISRDESSYLLDKKFDYIFFTGSTTVGRLIMEKASKFLTPLTLELGGKSPAIVSKDADLNLAIKRIVWGKFLNAGQTCIAVDYCLVHEDFKNKFKFLIKKQIKEFYYNNENKINNDFPFLISKNHADHLKSLLKPYEILNLDNLDSKLLLEPIILDDISFDDEIMKEEIFGPILPIIYFKNIEEVKTKLKSIDSPLALYYFSKNKKESLNFIKDIRFGAGAINDTIMHFTNPNLPFGGVGLSGFNAYHKDKTITTFIHEKSILVKGKIELNTKYPPINNNKLKFIKKIFKTK